MMMSQGSITENGLTAREARRRLAAIGPNELAVARKAAPILQVAQLFANPLIIILLLASIVSAFLGQVVSSVIIAVMVVLSVVLNFVQSFRSQRAVERLREGIAPTATVRRDGTWQEIPRRKIVPGDVIQLTGGDLVPADAVLLRARDLHVQEAALTGESLPVEKVAARDPENPAAAPDERSIIFLGTSVFSGTGTALVTKTGASTAYGDIAARLAARPPETDFERGTKQFGLLITKVTIMLVLFVLLVSAALRHDFLESVLFAVALAVGLTPEFLPMIMTVTLSSGAVRMARQKVIVKHLEAMQNFGSIDVLCSDKTGTLTRSEMRLEQAPDPSGRPSEKVFRLAYLNSAFSSGAAGPEAGRTGRTPNANPLDTAILDHSSPDIAGCVKADEIPFDFERRRSSVVIDERADRTLITKGAPESVLPICTRMDGEAGTEPLVPSAAARLEESHRELSSKGYRVLAVAYRAAEERQGYAVADESDLVFAGFVTFLDPPLEDAAGILGSLRRDGVDVKILTGDNELVAGHVCERVGIDVGEIVKGEDIDRMTDAALAHVAERTTVFARVSPAQKNRIIIALKSRGHVVGYLGDGINDAPSLHAADVGISVANAVDVAKDAADIILLERSLGVLHNGIVEGRKAFGNVMKYLLMGTSSNFGNMFSMAGAAFFLPYLPMLPMQILLNNFLYDLAQVTIPTDHVDKTFIRKPHRWDVRLIRNFMIYIGPVSSIYDFLTFFVLLKLFEANESLFQTGWFVESLATQTLVIFIIRTAGSPLRSRPSLPLAITAVSVVGIAIAIPFTPLAAPLGFTPLPFTYFAFLFFATGTYLLLVEAAKRRLMRDFLD